MNDDFLTRFRKPPRREFTEALYQRISKPMNAQIKLPRFRSFALALAAFVLLALAALSVPTVRAYAEGVLHRVGGFAFQQGVPITNNSNRPSPITLERTQNSIAIRVAPGTPAAKDAAGAAALAGFSVYVPAYLPAGYTDMGDWYVTDEDNGKTVTHGYRDASNHFLSVNQLKQSAGQPPKTYTEEQLVNVTVNGLPAVWIPRQTSDGGGKKALVWEERGITYWLVTVDNSLSLDEMIKVADSLVK